MRLNDDNGVVEVRDAIYSQWNYLRLGDASSTYDGAELTDAVITIPLNSVTRDTGYFEREFIVGFLDCNSDTITSISDATSSFGDTVDSFENVTGFTKNNTQQIRIKIKTEIIR